MEAKATSWVFRRLWGLVVLWCAQLRQIRGRAALQIGSLVRQRWRAIQRLLPAFGVLVAVFGTLLMTSVNVQWLSFVPALLSRVDDRGLAWEVLVGFEDPNWGMFEALDDPLDHPAAQFQAVSVLPSSATGFKELVELVERHVKRGPLGKVVAVQISPSGYTSSGRSIVGRYTVDFLFENVLEPFIMASMVDVADWIRDDRLDWGFAFGFPVLLFGLCISFVSEAIRWRGR